MFILIPLHRFFGRSDLQYIINYIKIGQVSFQFSENYSNQIWARFKEREIELSLTIVFLILLDTFSYIHLLYSLHFIQKRMACQPCRDIYGRRHASSRVLTARAGRMAIPTPSSNVIRRTNGPGYEGCRDPSSRKYGGSPVIGHDSLRWIRPSLRWLGPT